jgi:hypothetical protein
LQAIFRETSEFILEISSSFEIGAKPVFLSTALLEERRAAQTSVIRLGKNSTLGKN